MKQNAKLLVLLCAAAPWLAAGASAAAPEKTNTVAKPAVSPDALFTNSVVAKGKNVSITRNELDNEVVRVKATFAAQNQPAPSDLERQILDSLIIKQALLAKATDADKVKGKEQFFSQLQKFKTSGKMTEEEFNQKLSLQLKMMGMSKDQWEKQNIEQSTISQVIERDLKVNVTDDDAKKFFEENSANFERPEMVRAAHILVGTMDPVTREELSEDKKAAKKKQADDLLKRARAGEDFAKLAKEYSDDPGSKDKGGEYTFPRGQMVPEFEAAAFALNTNQVSDIVTTQFGYHIIKLYEKIPAKKETYAGLDTKTAFSKPDGEPATIKDVLIEQGRQKQIKSYMEQIKKDVDVQVLDESLKPMPSSSAPAAGSTNGAAKPAK